MAELGHPISGCEFYAHPQALMQADRLQLHAWKLSFMHPSTGALLTHIAPSVF
jgi:tRNA pseudouridine32 synthase/23S rRNA pseudouridine746 synthase